jgi:hypothetical protein
VDGEPTPKVPAAIPTRRRRRVERDWIGEDHQSTGGTQPDRPIVEFHRGIAERIVRAANRGDRSTVHRDDTRSALQLRSDILRQPEGSHAVLVDGHRSAAVVDLAVVNRSWML